MLPDIVLRDYRCTEKKLMWMGGNYEFPVGYTVLSLHLYYFHRCSFLLRNVFHFRRWFFCIHVVTPSISAFSSIILASSLSFFSATMRKEISIKSLISRRVPPRGSRKWRQRGGGGWRPGWARLKKRASCNFLTRYTPTADWEWRFWTLPFFIYIQSMKRHEQWSYVALDLLVGCQFPR